MAAGSRTMLSGGPDSPPQPPSGPRGPSAVPDLELRLCPHFETHGGCRKGRRCPLAHGMASPPADRLRHRLLTLMQQQLRDMGSPVRIHSVTWARGDLDVSRDRRTPATVIMELRAPGPSTASMAAMAAGRIEYQGQWLYPPVTPAGALELDPDSGAPLLHHGTSFGAAWAILRTGRLEASAGHRPEGVYATATPQECRSYNAGAVFKFASYGILSSKAAGKTFRDGAPAPVPEGLIVKIQRSQLEYVSNSASTELRAFTVPLFILSHYLAGLAESTPALPRPTPLTTSQTSGGSGSGGGPLRRPVTDLDQDDDNSGCSSRSRTKMHAQPAAAAAAASSTGPPPRPCSARCSGGPPAPDQGPSGGGAREGGSAAGPRGRNKARDSS